ncbi:MAG: 4Fe-4S dicluster domain-containing protein [Candidatus Lokiarchaeota archaeon]|nr:4Fe-4S dicluster domain-containing protein [Candidatus Lokiarchaeota archaeon]MBD3341918.1 4Fe-4S dicluster domain-containing protein [Candidatus Lokiarchaeota archaeon]
MSFPKLNKNSDENIDKIKVEFLSENLGLTLDKSKCTGCCVCVRICPKQAFKKYNTEGPTDLFGKKVFFKKKRYYIPFIHDLETCVFCGLCTYLCPFDALRLEYNGKEINPEEIKLVKSKAIPKLNYENVQLKSGKEAKVYGKGNIDINVEECNTGCKNCAEICPTGAISVKPDIISKDKSEWEQDLKIEIYPKDCIYCGACHSNCPTGALKLDIEEIFHSGDYNSPFWDEILNKLKLKIEQ